MKKNSNKEVDHNPSINFEEDLQVLEKRKKSQQVIQTRLFEENQNQNSQDRPQNHIIPSKKKKLWTYENEKLLIDLYVKYGNKWTELAENFQNLNGTFLKNKFYSRLRKGIRTINFMIKKFFNDLWEYFDCEVVFKLVSCTSNKYDFSSKCPLGKKIEYFEYFPEQIVHRVFMLSFFNKQASEAHIKQEEINKQGIQILVGNINLINERIDPKRSNRKQQIKKGKDKQKLKQENFVTSHQIKIQSQVYKTKYKHSATQLCTFQTKSCSKASKQFTKVQIVSTNSDQPMKYSNSKTSNPQQPNQEARVQDNINEISTVPSVRCSYRCINTNVRQLQTNRERFENIQKSLKSINSALIKNLKSQKGRQQINHLSEKSNRSVTPIKMKKLPILQMTIDEKY